MEGVAQAVGCRGVWDAPMGGTRTHEGVCLQFFLPFYDRISVV